MLGLDNKHNMPVPKCKHLQRDRQEDRQARYSKMDNTDACEKTLHFSKLALEVRLLKVVKFVAANQKLKRVRKRYKERTN